MFFGESMQDRFIRLIREGAAQAVTNERFIAHEIVRTKTSKEWKWMITGDDYFLGRQDIFKKQRMAIGKDGKLEAIQNLPNARLVDNVYRRMVKQKTNYLFGKPFSLNCESDQYREELTYFFDKSFMQKMKGIGKDALNCGIAWLYVYYNERGELAFKRFRPFEVIPEWKDADHTELDSVIRFYDISAFDGRTEKKITKVEYYTLSGVDFYEYWNGGLVAAPPYHQDYMTIGGEAYNWDRLPLIPFKYNDEEVPLIVSCKSLQDGLNVILSNFHDNMTEDARNTILVLVNYDGQNLDEFRHNLATYGAVKVRSVDGDKGDVRTLQVEVNSGNYKAISDILKRAIVENCMGYDAKDEKLGGTPNQMNIQSMYNDIDLDASDMEIEFQAALDTLMHFVDLHLLNSGSGDFSGEEVQITFNTNMPMDEANAIQNAQNSAGIISKRTITAHHPWVTDLDAELQQLEVEEAEDRERIARQYDPFAGQGAPDTSDNQGEGEK